MKVTLDFKKTFEIKTDPAINNLLSTYYENTEVDSDFLSIENFDKFIADIIAPTKQKEDSRKVLISINNIIAESEKDGYLIDADLEESIMLS